MNLAKEMREITNGSLRCNTDDSLSDSDWFLFEKHYFLSNIKEAANGGSFRIEISASKKNADDISDYLKSEGFMVSEAKVKNYTDAVKFIICW